MINLSVKIGNDEHIVGMISGDTAVNLNDPQQAELIAMMVIDWAEGIREGGDPE